MIFFSVVSNMLYVAGSSPPLWPRAAVAATPNCLSQFLQDQQLFSIPQLGKSLMNGEKNIISSKAGISYKQQQ